MPSFNTGTYRLEISHIANLCDTSADHFDTVFTTETGYQPSSMLSIELYQDDVCLKSILIAGYGGGTTIHPSSLVIDESQIVTCCGNAVFCITIPELTLKWKTRADDATCFEVFKYQDDYIVHGEMEISRVDKNGVIVWQRSGADIYTTPTGKDDFKVTDDFIIATDWNYQQYKFAFDGNIMR